MKIAGRKIEGMNKRNIVIPRPDGDIVLVAQGVPTYKEFGEICPIPVAPKKKFPNGRMESVTDDPQYKEACNQWAERKTSWLILKSLEATPGLEWELVDLANPDTWNRYQEELAQAGFSEPELARIIEGVMEANGLNQAVLDEAEKRFLASQAQE